MRALRREFLAGMRLEDVGFCSCGSFVLYAASLGARNTEVPVHIRDRRRGRSKVASTSKTEMHQKQARFLFARYGEAEEH